MKLSVLIFASLVGASLSSYGQMRGYAPQPMPVYQQPTYQPQATPVPVYTAPKQVYQPREYTTPTREYTPSAQPARQVYQPHQGAETSHEYAPKTESSPAREAHGTPAHTHPHTRADADSSAPPAEQKTSTARTHRHPSPSQDTSTDSEESNGHAAVTRTRKNHAATPSESTAQSETTSARPDRHQSSHTGNSPQKAVASNSPGNKKPADPHATQGIISRPHTNSYPSGARPQIATTSTSVNTTSGASSPDTLDSSGGTAVNTGGGHDMDPRVAAFYAGETARYELTSQVLDTWNNALELEFADAPNPAPDAGPVAAALPPVALEAATAVAQDEPASARSSRPAPAGVRPNTDSSAPRVAAATNSHPAASAVAGDATKAALFYVPDTIASGEADDIPPAPSASPVPASENLLAVSESNLAQPDQLEFDTLLSMAFQLQSLTGPEAATAQTAFLDRSDVYLKTHPDERALWLLRARLALHANLASVGAAAGANLQRLACFNDPKLHGLMVAMNMHKWLPDGPLLH